MTVRSKNTSQKLDTKENSVVSCGAGQLLMTDSGASCEIVFGTGTDNLHTAILTASGQIVGCTHRTSVTIRGARQYRIIDEYRLCRVLAFIDAALPAANDKSASSTNFCLQDVPDTLVGDDPSAIEHWLTLEVMQGNKHNALIRHLRRLEAYTLIGYLLQAPGDGGHLNELCVRYGLSYSHFRRLCHQALGCPVKPQLREWRAARTMLDLMVSEYPVLAIALDNGYASASHISKEIKQLFGITPRMAKNARALLP